MSAQNATQTVQVQRYEYLLNVYCLSQQIYYILDIINKLTMLTKRVFAVFF